MLSRHPAAALQPQSQEPGLEMPLPGQNLANPFHTGEGTETRQEGQESDRVLTESKGSTRSFELSLAQNFVVTEERDT